MIDSTLLDNIESSEKAVVWGMVGSRRRLDAAVLTDPDVRDMLNVLRDHPDTRLELVTRIGTLASMGGNPEYLHCYDLAIFAYLRALDILDPELAAVAAPRVATLGNVWWSRPLALRLRMPSHTSSRGTDSRSEVADMTEAHGASRIGSTKCSPDAVNTPSIVYPDSLHTHQLIAGVVYNSGVESTSDTIQEER